MQSLAAVSKANTADVQPLMSRLDTLLRSLLADFSTDNAGKHAQNMLYSCSVFCVRVEHVIIPYSVSPFTYAVVLIRC